MFSVRSASAASALALSLVVASAPARSASTTVIGTVVKQSPPIHIANCSADLDGDAYKPSVELDVDARVAVVESFELTFLDPKGKVTGTERVSPPFVTAAIPGGAFAAMRCEVAEMRLDDGTTFTNAPPAHDSHAVGNALIGIGILGAIGFVASRNTNSGSNDGATAAPTDTPTPTPAPTGSGGATATPTATPANVATPVRLIATATPLVATTPAPAPSPPATVAPATVAPAAVRPQVIERRPGRPGSN